MKRILPFLMLLLMAGCTLDKKMVEAACALPMTAYVYEQGRPRDMLKISPTNELHAQIATWLKSNREGWHTSYNSYAPRVLIRNDNMSINCFSNAVILNIGGSNGGSQSQYVKNLDTSKLVFLKDITKQAEPTDAAAASLGQ
jgi:hypothetical protein